MSEQINLLLVEDNEFDATLLVHGLRKAGFEVNMQRVQTADEMQAALAQNNWDAVISDYKLPAFSAPRALETLRTSGKDLPFIVVSGTIGEETAVVIMRAGAHDYLMKGNLSRLAEALRREIRDARGREESRQAEAALRISEQQLRLLFERSNDAIFVVDKKTGRYVNANQAAETLTGHNLGELRKLTVFDLTGPAAIDRMKQIETATSSVEFNQVIYTRPDGSTRTAELTVLPISETLTFGIAHDITEQLRAETALKQRAQELELLFRTSLEINTQTDLLPLLQSIVERVASLLTVRTGGMYLLRPEDQIMELVVCHCLPDNLVGTRLALGEGLAGQVALTGETIAVPNYQVWPKRAAVYEGISFHRTLGVPLRIKGQIIGALIMSDDEITGPFSPEDIRLASLFADQAAIAVENARLLEAVQQELKERRQAEQALRESEERYRIVVTGAPLISFVIDEHGIFTLSEGRGLSVLGFKPGQVVGQSVFDIYRDIPEIIEDMQLALAGEPRRRDTQVGENTFEIHYIPIKDDGGSVTHVIGVATDISERKRAEESVRESEKSYRGLFNSVEEAIYIHDAQGRFMDVNTGAVNMYGHPAEYFTGKTPDDLSAPGKNNLALVHELFNKAFGGEPQRIEFWGQRANGENFPKEVRMYPGTYFGKDVVISMATDITERKRAEENLRSTQAFLDHVLKAVPLGISVCSFHSMQMEFDNAVSMAYSGMSMQEFNNLSSNERQELIHPDDRARLSEFMHLIENLRDGEVREIEYRRAAGGEWHWFRYRYFVFERDENGAISRLLFVTEDVTATRQANQALQRQLRELTTLHQIASAGIQVNTVDELVEQVTNEVGTSFYPDNFGVLLLDETGKTLVAHPSYRGIDTGIHSIASLEHSISGPVIITGQPRRIPDVRLESEYIEVTSGIRSELCVPIQTGEHTIGVINAESKTLDFFSDADERLLMTVAGQMAIAIERIRLFESERQQRQESETLRQATAALSTSLDLDHVLESILTSLKQVVPYDSASVFLLEGDFLHVTVANGIGPENDVLGKSFPADDALFLEVKSRHAPIILENASLDPRFNQWGKTSYVRGWMSVPLISRGEVIGYITLDNRQVAAYDQYSANMAQAFAHQAAAAMENARLYEGLQDSLKEMNQAYESTIEGWSKAMDLRDKETEGHTLRVTDMTTKLATAMGISGEALVHMRRGALLHDIGKMGVPDRILLKPDTLTDDELLIMRRHPRYAYDMLSPISYLRPALDIPYSHHERWDGRGYPLGLKGENIPLAARLFAVIDVWDALTSDRPYRPAWTRQEALAYIKELSGVQFDARIVEKFVELLDIITVRSQ